MNEKDSELLARAMTECYASTNGCKRLPIRAVIEAVSDPDENASVNMVLMCVDHAATYRPEGRVIKDDMLVSDENLKMFTELGL